MDEQDKQRFVQQYVDRQRAYLPTYTAQHLSDECHRDGSPPKPSQSDAFGFSTPVLRPRVPADVRAQPPLALKAGPNKSLGPREVEPDPNPLSREVVPETRDPTLSKEKTKSERRKASRRTDTDNDNDNERAARLADRRERKKKKRAIVNPPEKQDDDIAPATTLKKGKMNSQKTKRPAALALLYGFSATNVTRDRLTLKPAPCLGVFNKGKASGKKKVTMTGKSSSRNELFSESAFLNKPSEWAADHSIIDDDSDDSSVSNHPIPQEVRSMNRTKKGRVKCTSGLASKTPQVSARTTAESEVWDIELQSKLPSSACDVRSEFVEKDSAPVVLDVREAEWSASLDVAVEREKCKTPTLSVTCSPPRQHSVVSSSPLVESDPRAEVRFAQAADVSSVHPSHSASQVGRRVADPQRFNPCSVVTSRYFTKPKPVLTRGFAADLPVSNDDAQLPDLSPGALLHFARPKQVSVPRSNDGTQTRSLRSETSVIFTGFESVSAPKLYSGSTPVGELAANPQSQRLSHDRQVPDQAISCAGLDVRMVHRAASPINSVTSIPQPMIAFETQYDMIPLDFPSDSSPYDGCMDIPWEPLGGPDHDHFGCSMVETQGEGSISALECRGDWYRTSAYDVDFEGAYDPLAPTYQSDPEGSVPISEPCFFDEDEPGQGQGEAEQDLAMCEDGSVCYSEQGFYEAENVANFLEGRALLLGIPEDPEERPRRMRMSGLAQAEMDVASRLRDHWRPLRL